MIAFFCITASSLPRQASICPRRRGYNGSTDRICLQRTPRGRASMGNDCPTKRFKSNRRDALRRLFRECCNSPGVERHHAHSSLVILCTRSVRTRSVTGISAPSSRQVQIRASATYVHRIFIVTITDELVQTCPVWVSFYQSSLTAADECQYCIEIDRYPISQVIVQTGHVCGSFCRSFTATADEWPY